MILLSECVCSIEFPRNNQLNELLCSVDPQLEQELHATARLDEPMNNLTCFHKSELAWKQSIRSIRLSYPHIWLIWTFFIRSATKETNWNSSTDSFCLCCLSHRKLGEQDTFWRLWVSNKALLTNPITLDPQTPTEENPHSHNQLKHTECHDAFLNWFPSQERSDRRAFVIIINSESSG